MPTNYKVWDRKEKKFVYPIHHIKLDRYNEILEVNDIKNEFIGKFDKRFVLMMSSECWDVTGEEIFDRDIVLIFPATPYDYLEIGTVKFEHGSFVVNGRILGRMVKDFFCDLKIIGNAREGVQVDINQYRLSAEELRQRIKEKFKKKND